MFITSAVATFVAPAVGGYMAAQRAPEAPLIHGAAAAATAAVIYVALRILDGVINGRSVLAGELVILIQLTVLMGMLGGHVSQRRRPSS